MKKDDKSNPQRKYPILPYLLAMFAAVIALVLLSYFAQSRNSQQISEYSEAHSYKIEDLSAKVDELESRVDEIELRLNK
ncbi:MAG: hypothetical protein RR147_05635 [Oscillospiraceae bacterium]